MFLLPVDLTHEKLLVCETNISGLQPLLLGVNLGKRRLYIDFTMKKRRLNVSDYTVGWVCALPLKLAAAAEMLDDEHEDIPRDSTDTNVYTLGRVGKHNVVLECLPAGETGTNSAANIATQMTAKFRSIRFGLMVGIGGGLPSSEHTSVSLLVCMEG